MLIEPFENVNKDCPKCGRPVKFPHKSRKIKYISESILNTNDKNSTFSTYPEHLKVTCRYCKYSFDTECKDKF